MEASYTYIVRSINQLDSEPTSSGSTAKCNFFDVFWMSLTNYVCMSEERPAGLGLSECSYLPA